MSLTVSCVNAADINESLDASDNLLAQDNQKILTEKEIGDFSQLSSEINSSIETKQLYLTKDYAFDSNSDGEYNEGIPIDIDDLIIDGKGHTINANQKARIFNIKSDNVILKNINIINGKIQSNGAAIYWSGANGSLINCQIKNSATPNIGGGIYFENNAKVIDSTFENNSAYFGGGLNFENDGTVINSSLKDNYATLLGGGIYFVEKGFVFNSTFTNNEGGDGGGIYFFKTGLVENTKFIKNIAIGYGAGITADEKLVVRNSQFIDNVGMFAASIFLKDGGNVENSIFINNSANRESGCIYFLSNGNVENCTFTDNSASWAGAILFDKEGTLKKSIFTSNAAAGDGGAVYFNANGIVEDSIFNRNSANLGGGIFAKYGELMINDTQFNNNLAKSNGNSLYITSQQIILENLSFVGKSTYENEVYINNPTAHINKISFKNEEKITKTKIKTAITAKSQTFKAKAKTKKITITLKANGKALNKKKVTLKINKKTYTAKTSKGKAVFKIKLTKKGKFTALIKFAGDNSYKASQKKISVKIK